MSTTHLHEFKSADKGQAPVMSLYLPEQKLGSHSAEGGTSNKFILKGRQAGSMHRGHTWVFRAESHDTMMAWYDDIKALTEKTPEERSHFVRSHSRSMSQSSRRSASSDGLVDEDDEEPFSAGSQIDVNPGPRPDAMSRRSQPGGRFPSDIQVNAQRGLQAPRSHSSLGSSAPEHQQQGPDVNIIAAAAALPGAAHNPTSFGQDQDLEQDRQRGYGNTEQSPIQDVPSHAVMANHEAFHDGVNPYTSEPVQPQQPNYQYENRTYIPPVAVGHQQQMPPDDYIGEQQQHHHHHHHQHLRQESQPFADSYAHPTAENQEYTTQPQQETMNGGVFVPDISTLGPIEGKRRDSSILSETTIENAAPMRPTGARNDSVNTISNLHVPGSFPRGSAA